MSSPKKIFISYAHKDRAWKDKLRTQLAIPERMQKLIIWEDSHLLPGQEWSKEIESQLAAADIYLFLVSADLLASGFIWDVEMRAALAREEAGQAVVIPVIMRSCGWQHSPLGSFQALPMDGRPVALQADEDEALYEVVRKIESLLG